MRTKTLIIAAAALAAGILTSSAQTYSQNIVGYVNQILVGNSAFNAVTAPLIGTSNAVDVLMPSLQNGDSILIWNPSGFTYAQAYYIGPGANQPGGTGYGNWTYDFVNLADSPTVAPGQGFFYATTSGNRETNTFVGTVVLSNTVPLLGNSAFNLVASTPPIGGYCDSTNFNVPLQNGDSVLVWDPVGFTWSQDYYIGPGYNQPGGTGFGNWTYDFVNLTNAPFITVGQGFFYATTSGNAEQWIQNLIVP